MAKDGMCFNLPFSLRLLLLSVKHLRGAWRAAAGGSGPGSGRLGRAQLSMAAVMGTGKAESGTEREMGLEHIRLLLIICIGNIVWFSSVCSHSMCLFSALRNFCENLLMLYKLGERHVCLFICLFFGVFLFCFFPFNA